MTLLSLFSRGATNVPCIFEENRRLGDGILVLLSDREPRKGKSCHWWFIYYLAVAYFTKIYRVPVILMCPLETCVHTRLSPGNHAKTRNRPSTKETHKK